MPGNPEVCTSLRPFSSAIADRARLGVSQPVIREARIAGLSDTIHPRLVNCNMSLILKLEMYY